MNRNLYFYYITFGLVRAQSEAAMKPGRSSKMVCISAFCRGEWPDPGNKLIEVKNFMENTCISILPSFFVQSFNAFSSSHYSGLESIVLTLKLQISEKPRIYACLNLRHGIVHIPSIWNSNDRVLIIGTEQNILNNQFHEIHRNSDI